MSILPTITLAYPDHTRFALLDFPLHLPLDLLGPELMARVLSIVLLEQKVRLTRGLSGLGLRFGVGINLLVLQENDTGA